MDLDIFKWVLSNLIIFSIIVILLGYFVNKTRFERYIFAESAIELANSNAKIAELQRQYAYYDEMTGLLNRMAYSEKIEELQKNSSSVSCVIVIDVNDLKQLNDLKGHVAGDELIMGTAVCLEESFKKNSYIYRLGGDEFCIFVEDDKDFVNKCLSNLVKTIRNYKGKYFDCISLSYGVVFNEDNKDIETILKLADDKMYEYKSNYYKREGRDRRRKV